MYICNGGKQNKKAYRDWVSAESVFVWSEGTGGKKENENMGKREIKEKGGRVCREF